MIWQFEWLFYCDCDVILSIMNSVLFLFGLGIECINLVVGHAHSLIIRRHAITARNLTLFITRRVLPVAAFTLLAAPPAAPFIPGPIVPTPVVVLRVVVFLALGL